MIKLPDVTLVSTASIRIYEHIKAIEICCKDIEFGQVIFVSHKKPENLPDYITFKSCKKIENIMDYNQLIFMDLGDVIETNHALLCQDHAYILHPELWDDEWLNFDYLGGIWPIAEGAYIANTGERVRNGNGGFSLRSRKMMRLPKEKDWYLRQEQGFYNEDGNSTCYWRKEFLDEGIKYAPLEFSAKFSFETPVLENDWGKMQTFGFHRNLPQLATENNLRVIKLS